VGCGGRRGRSHGLGKASINAGPKVTANAIIDRAAGFENVTQMMNDNRIALEAFKAKTAPKFTGT
jgi:enoyl-CoA hydratase